MPLYKATVDVYFIAANEFEAKRRVALSSNKLDDAFSQNGWVADKHTKVVPNVESVSGITEQEHASIEYEPDSIYYEDLSDGLINYIAGA